MRERSEQRLVEQFIAQAADERLGEGILRRLAWRGVMPSDLVSVRPVQNGIRGQLCAVVADDRPGLAVHDEEAIELATRMPEIEVSATSARHSRVQSSTTTRMRIRLRGVGQDRRVHLGVRQFAGRHPCMVGTMRRKYQIVLR